MANKLRPPDVEKYLKGLDYPATKAELVKYVRQEMQQILEILQQLPDETFHRPTDVAKALGELERAPKS